jgi:hypothetical protein
MCAVNITYSTQRAIYNYGSRAQLNFAVISSVVYNYLQLSGSSNPISKSKRIYSRILMKRESALMSKVRVLPKVSLVQAGKFVCCKMIELWILTEASC